MADPTVSCYNNYDYRGGVLNVVGRDIPGTEVDIYRYTSGTDEKILVRGGYGYAVDSQTVVVTDPEVPLNETVAYEIVMMPNGREDPLRQSIFTSGCRAADQSKLYTDGTCSPIYLSDPLLPSFGYWFGLLGIDPLTYPPRGELYDVLGRRAPVAVSQKRSTARTSLRLYTKSLEEREQILQMLEAGRILLYRNPDKSYPERHWYIAIGDVSEERIVPDHRDPRRRWILTVAVVDRPVGYLSLVKSDRSYAKYQEFEPDGITPITPDTYAGTKSDYADYVDVLLGLTSASYAEAPAARSAKGAMIPVSASQVYGEGRYPTVSAARTSWSLL